MLTPDEEARKAKLLQELNDLEDGARARFLRSERERTYRFANIVDPKKLEEIRRFQQIFGRYIPDLLEDEHATIHLHQRLLDGIFGNPISTINKSTFEADLKRFRGAIQALAEWDIWGAMVNVGYAPALLEARDENDVLRAAREIYDFLLLIDDLAHYDKKLPQVLNQLESWTREVAEDLPDRRNIGWEAAHTVDQLRGFWESWTETPAPPRALNPTSPFADYLRDAFKFFNISGDPIGAFKRLVAVEDARRARKRK
jgi:hypothetical protein